MKEIRDLIETRNVPGYPGYTVDSFGSVYHNGKLKTLCSRKNGLKNYISISYNGQNKQVTAASLVCTGFHGPPKKGEYVVYLDGNIDNIAASNLKWGSRKEAFGNIYRYRLITKDVRDTRIKKRYSEENSSVYKLNEDRLIIESYKNIEEASVALDVPKKILIDACMKNTRLCWHYWCFSEDYYGIGENDD